jgi:tetratricopeptide (TPR) repeat protein
MRLLIILTFFTSLNVFGQQMTLEEWNRQAETNIRLLPKYGLITKTAEQKASDESLISDMLSKGFTRRQASEQFIDLGFKYLYKDIKTAMYRFNQAYLMDSTNIDIYWGFGGVYMTLGDINRAKEQYEIGLSKDANNSKIITDLATCYMIDYYELSPIDSEKAKLKLNTAIELFTKSYKIDKKNQNTLFKISACYYNMKDCENALKFYNECMKLGGEPITEEYKAAMKVACEKK